MTDTISISELEATRAAMTGGEWLHMLQDLACQQLFDVLAGIRP